MSDLRSLSNSFFDEAFRWVWPHRCPICGALGAVSVCDSCLSELKPLGESLSVSPELIERAVAIYDYSGPAKQAVHRLKYEGESALIQWMSEQIALEVRKLGWGDQIFVPVPIHRTRQLERAFNQAEALCESLQAPVEKLLVRTKKTIPQAALDKALRSDNIRGAFAASGEVAGREIVIVDDVCTTGSTVSECAKVLLRAGAKSVRVLAFAGVP